MIIFKANTSNDIKEKAEKILEETGLDLDTAFSIMLKRIVKENSAMFLFDNSNKPVEEENRVIEVPNLSGKETGMGKIELSKDCQMTKSNAIILFRQKGFDLSGKTTFASKNNSANNYWANPPFSYLDGKWNLILNDWAHQVLHLFIIPAGEIPSYTLVGRSDKKETVDLQILYDDCTFTDTRSKFSFLKFYQGTIHYDATV